MISLSCFSDISSTDWPIWVSFVSDCYVLFLSITNSLCKSNFAFEWNWFVWIVMLINIVSCYLYLLDLSVKIGFVVRATHYQ